MSHNNFVSVQKRSKVKAKAVQGLTVAKLVITGLATISTGYLLSLLTL